MVHMWHRLIVTKHVFFKALIEQRNQQEAAIQQLKEEMDKERPEPAPSTSMSAAAEKQVFLSILILKKSKQESIVLCDLIFYLFDYNVNRLWLCECKLSKVNRWITF